MNKVLKSVRRTAQSAVVTMLLVGIATPACTTSHALGPAAAANTPMPVEASSVRQQDELVPESPLVFLDESHKSVLVEPDDERAMTSSEAIYIEEPMASGYVPVSDNLWKVCDDQNVACVPACINALPARKRKDKKLQKDCVDACQAAYMLCLHRLGLVKKVFEAFDSAWAWIKDHKGAIVGTIVVIGGVAYVVSTAGSGALVLVPLLG